MLEGLEQTLCYDKTRKLNLVRVHDGAGNLFTFNCRPDIPLEVRAVVEQGELITVKLKGDKWKRLDDITDQHYRKYMSLVPLEFKDADMTEEEFTLALAEARNRAPKPGDETSYAAHVSLGVVEPTIDDLRQHGKKVGRYKEHDVYRPDRSRSGYILFEVRCMKCPAKIKGKRAVSTDGQGKYTRIQGFAPFDNSRFVLTEGWTCESCLKKTNADISDKMEKEVPITEAEVEIVGLYGVKFKQRGDKFFYKDYLIVPKGPVNYRGTLIDTFCINPKVNCAICGQLVQMTVPIQFKDGKPCRVNTATSTDARPVKFKSTEWAHIACLDGEKEPKADLEKPQEKPKKQAPFNTIKGIEELKGAALPEPEPEKEAQPEQEAQEEPQEEKQEEKQGRTLDLTPGGRPPVDLLKRMQEMALDSSINSDVFRGAAYMYFLTMGGNDDDETDS